MSVPPIPVVPAWVWEELIDLDGHDAPDEAFCRTKYCRDTPERGDVPAVAVPDTLWTDELFLEAVAERAVPGDDAHDALVARVLVAVRDELRARADGAA